MNRKEEEPINFQPKVGLAHLGGNDKERQNKKSQLSDESDLEQFGSDQLPPLHYKSKVQSIGKKIKKPVNLGYLGGNNEKGDGSSAMLTANKPQGLGIHVPISKKVCLS